MPNGLLFFRRGKNEVFVFGRKKDEEKSGIRQRSPSIPKTKTFNLLNKTVSLSLPRSLSLKVTFCPTSPLTYNVSIFHYFTTITGEKPAFLLHYNNIHVLSPSKRGLPLHSSRDAKPKAMLSSTCHKSLAFQ